MQDENTKKLNSTKSLLASYEIRLKSYLKGNNVPLSQNQANRRKIEFDPKLGSKLKAEKLSHTAKIKSIVDHEYGNYKAFTAQHDIIQNKNFFTATRKNKEIDQKLNRNHLSGSK